jgi:hypothetical protein
MLSKIVFFFFALIAIIYEMWAIKNSEKLVGFAKLLKQAEKDEIKLEPKASYSAFIICQFLYCFWALVGLFSSQWIIFVILILMGTTSFLPFAKTRIWIISDSIVTLGLLLFGILNAFHLHIPLWSRFLDYCL